MSDRYVCIGGNKYRVVDGEDTGSDTQDNSIQLPQIQTTVDMSVTEQLLSRLVDIAGGGNIGGGYRSIVQTIPAKDTQSIELGIRADNINIRSDQSLKINFNDPQSDNIFVDATEFPFSISGLKMNETIHTLYITTFDNDTTVKILAFGLVK